MTRGCATFGVLACFLFASTAARADGIISNGAFQQSLTGWTSFTTRNGTLGAGEPQVAAFSPGGMDTYNAAQFQVDQAVPSGNTDDEGGGIFQDVTLGAGYLQLSVNVAAQGGTSANLYGGYAQLLIDMQPVAGYDFGALQAGQVQTATLSVQEWEASGSHSVAVEFLRPATEDITSPYQYASQFQALEEAPEPSSFSLGAMPLLFLLYRRKRC